jgi:hypothetical protein
MIVTTSRKTMGCRSSGNGARGSTDLSSAKRIVDTSGKIS